MFRITTDPSSGNFIQCLAKILYFHLQFMLFWPYLILKQTYNLSNYSKYAAIIPATSMSTDTIEPLL